MKVLKIEDRQFINELEGLQNEVQARQAIITFMINSGSDITTESFQAYQKEYTNLFQKYEQKKYDVEKLFIRPNVKNPSNWNLDFNSGELVVEEQ